jgi:hypothetical protein
MYEYVYLPVTLKPISSFFSFIKNNVPTIGFTVITARALVLTLEKHRHMRLSNVILMQISLA